VCALLGFFGKSKVKPAPATPTPRLTVARATRLADVVPASHLEEYAAAGIVFQELSNPQIMRAIAPGSIARSRTEEGEKGDAARCTTPR